MHLKKRRIELKYLILLSLAVFLLANRGFRSLARNYFELRRLKNRKIELQSEKLGLEQSVRLMKEPGQIEYAARKELGLTRPGEIVYRFPPPREEKDDK